MMLLGAVYVLNPTQMGEFSGAREEFHSDDLSTSDQCPDGADISQVCTYDILLPNAFSACMRQI